MSEIWYTWGWRDLEEIEVIKKTDKTIWDKGGSRKRIDSYDYPIFPTKKQAVDWRRHRLTETRDNMKKRLGRAEADLKDLNVHFPEGGD